MYEEISRNRRGTWVLIITFIAFVSLLGYIFGQITRFGYSAVAIALVFALIMSFSSYYYSDKIVLSISGAEPADREQYRALYNSVEGLSIAAGLPVPRIYFINDPAPNAFATGRDPEHSAIAVTSGLLDMMNKLELEGVIAHEMSHVADYDIKLSTLAVVMVGTIVLLSAWLRQSAFWGGLRRGRDRDNAGVIILIIALVFAILAPIAAQLLRLALSRNREYLADAQGAMLTRYPPGLANALRKLSEDEHRLRTANEATANLFIVNPYKADAASDADIEKPAADERKQSFGDRYASLFSTHPPIQERIKRLDEMSLGEAPGMAGHG
jgi:heat shock protein HtpX